MTPTTPVCNGTITQDLNGLLHCDVAWSMVATPQAFSISQIDPAMMGAALAAGVVVGGVPFAFAWGGRQIYETIMGKKR